MTRDRNENYCKGYKKRACTFLGENQNKITATGGGTVGGQPMDVMFLISVALI